MTSQKTQSKPVKIAVVGDIHDQWDVEDGMALKHLGVDLVLFVGDFGNESVEVVKTIASLDIPKAAVMGNHDAWYSATEWGRKKCPYDRTKEDWVQKQLDLLGAVQVGYSKLDFPQWNLSSLDDSADKIVKAVKNATCDNIIFLGHNGPSGLGDRAEDPCGKDWHPIGGDFGDPDLAAAISQTLNMNKTVSLVAFGHMHRTLRHTKKLERKAVFKSPEGTIYLNAANVPRIVQENGVKLRNFSLVFLDGGMVTKVALVWVGKDYQVAAEEIFYNSLV